MDMVASRITSLTIVYSTVYSDADKKASKLCVTGLCAGYSPGPGLAQMASNAENVSIWWRHHELQISHGPIKQRMAFVIFSLVGEELTKRKLKNAGLTQYNSYTLINPS